MKRMAAIVDLARRARGAAGAFLREGGERRFGMEAGYARYEARMWAFFGLGPPLAGETLMRALGVGGQESHGERSGWGAGDDGGVWHQPGMALGRLRART